RALAKAIYETFTTFVGNMLYISTQEDMHERMPIPEMESPQKIIQNTSLAKAYQQINQPLLYLNDKKYILENVIIKMKVQGNFIFSYYALDDIRITLNQKWLKEGRFLESDILLESAQYYETDTRANLHFYGAYTNSDKSYVGSAIVESSAIYVTITNIQDISYIDQILNDLIFYP
ncbi:MAG: hypothetical protein AAGU75_18165, partial [Bacillota bacterium]